MTAPKVERRKIADYRPDPANPNKHSERGVSMLEDSLASVGLGRSIVVDKNGIVLAGNSTQERAIDQGFENAIEVESDGKSLIVVKRTDLDLLSDDKDNRARKLSYYDNRSAELGIAWDAEQLLADVNAGVDLSHLFSTLELMNCWRACEMNPYPTQAHKLTARLNCSKNGRSSVVICGLSASIGCCAAIARMLTMWRG